MIIRKEQQEHAMDLFDLENDFKPLIKMTDTYCFGCSPSNEAGLKMRFHAGKDSVISRLNVPQHLCGWRHIVHGGIVSAILDETMSWSTIYLLKRVVLTTSITVDFIKPVFAAKAITSQGKVLERISEREAIMEGTIFDSEGEVCAKSRGTFRLFTPEAARKYSLMSPDILDDFENFIRTHENHSTGPY
ncbi:MAG: PaaI family thioesterase [Proteobacteria bacterium]|nr:PaaI family thioesterase [Pseudomonadota bacterium]